MFILKHLTKDLVFDSNAITVIARHHVGSLLLHQLVSVDGIFADHVVEMPQVRLSIGKGRPCVSDPVFCTSVAVVLIVVKLRSHEG